MTIYESDYQRTLDPCEETTTIHLVDTGKFLCGIISTDQLTIKDILGEHFDPGDDDGCECDDSSNCACHLNSIRSFVLEGAYEIGDIIWYSTQSCYTEAAFYPSQAAAQADIPNYTAYMHECLNLEGCDCDDPDDGDCDACTYPDYLVQSVKIGEWFNTES